MLKYFLLFICIYICTSYIIFNYLIELLSFRLCVRDSNASILTEDIPVLNGYAPLPWKVKGFTHSYSIFECIPLFETNFDSKNVQSSILPNLILACISIPVIQGQKVWLWYSFVLRSYGPVFVISVSVTRGKLFFQAFHERIKIYIKYVSHTTGSLNSVPIYFL